MAVKITEEKARELAQQYAQEYLPGFKVERVIPFAVFQTLYSVELQNHCGETRTLRVNPFASVSGPWKISP
jgi:hypothetical protein